MGFGPSYGSALAGCEGAPAGQRYAGRQAGEESEGSQLAWSRPREMRQRLDDRVGIRQPVRETEVPGHRTTRIPRGMQNPNRAKTEMCDKRVYNYAKNRIRYMREASVCSTSLLCIR